MYPHLHYLEWYRNHFMKVLCITTVVIPTVSKIPQTVRPRVALQLDLKTAYLAGCQRVVHQLVRGWTLACPRGCASDSSKASWLHFSLTRKLHIWLAVQELYISSSGVEHQSARGAVHRTPRRHLSKASVGCLRDTIFVTWAVCKASVYPA